MKAGAWGQEGDILAIIPAFNEELTIGSMVLRTSEYVDRVIVVDDGSTDKTADVAGMAGATLIRMGKNQGKAKALMAGLRNAQESEAGVVVLMDGDGQHEPTDIPKVIEPVINGQSDMVIGSRLPNNGDSIPAHRRVGQKVLNRLVAVNSKMNILDTQSGFRALNRKALQNIDFESKGYGVESIMIMHFAERGLRISEVPIRVRYDVPYGHKERAFKTGIKLSGQILSYTARKKPKFLLSVPGIALIILGIIMELSTNANFPETGWSQVLVMHMAIFTVILGLVLFFTGIIIHFSKKEESSHPIR